MRRKKKWYNCWIFHRWSKWTMGTKVTEYWNKYTGEKVSSIEGQALARECLVCGKTQMRSAWK